MSAELIQRSAEWFRARCGSVGASQIADVCAKTKSGYAASRANLMAQLLCERLTGAPTEGYVSAAMQHGIDTEAEARAAYEFYRDVTVQEVGLIKHPALAFAHASPDGLIGSDGILELKCPQPATHLDILLGETFPQKYVLQVQWQMACTGRQWADLASYDPRMPPAMRLFVTRIPRDEHRIAEITVEVRAFLGELANKYIALTTKYDAPKEAA